MFRVLTLISVWAPIAASGGEPEMPAATFEYGLQVFDQPRPLRLHWVRVNLRSDTVKVVPIVATDPDGAGPAEAALTKPEALMRGASALAAVNANAFQVLPGTKLSDGGWFENRPVIISGWVVRDGQVLSPMDGPLEQLWATRGGTTGFGSSVPDPAQIEWAVGTHAAKHGVILRAGAIEVEDSTFSTHLHPRTALGLDAGGTRLWMVVVDGRSPGFSEGVSLAELATFMKKLGCAHALNLDGGGSTVLMLTDDAGNPRVMNRPSDGATRPVPVILGIRQRTRDAH
ncbi:MAG: phosphodiester glycosidase family protein [Verrucomicrobiales bacterium]|nr:phosphodiester glycosidase family protein [Verrucomicrobiales bacterium]